MTVKPKPLSRPWWNYVRFSLRALIVLVLLIGAGLGWLVRSAHVQRDAVAAIRRAGGSVSYDWEWSNGKSIPGGKPWAPRWLTDLIGVDYFAHVTSVWLQPAATDGAIVEVGHLTQLERLQLVGSFHQRRRTSTSEGAYQTLGTLPQQHSGQRRRAGTSEGADQAQVPPPQRHSGHRRRASASEGADQSLGTDPQRHSGHRRRAAHLKGLTNLTVLFLLDDTQVTDAGLMHLKGLTRLSSLTSRVLTSPTPGWRI